MSDLISATVASDLFYAFVVLGSAFALIYVLYRLEQHRTNRMTPEERAHEDDSARTW